MAEPSESQGGWNLTPRQMECLKLYYLRKSTKKVARQLDISADTVEVHLRQCRIRLNAPSTMDAAEMVFGVREEVTVNPYYDPTGIPDENHPLQFELTPNADVPFRGVAGNMAPINPFGVLQTLAIILAIALGAIVAVVLIVELGQGINRLGSSLMS